MGDGFNLLHLLSTLVAVSAGQERRCPSDWQRRPRLPLLLTISSMPVGGCDAKAFTVWQRLQAVLLAKLWFWQRMHVLKKRTMLP